MAADSALGDRIDMRVHEHAGDPRRGAPCSSSRPACRPRSATSRACSSRQKTEVVAADQAAQHADQPDPGHRRPRAGSLRSASGWLRGLAFQILFLTAVAFSVSAIPTGLPAVVTTILASGTSDAGQGRRNRQAAALGRDARLDVGHQLGQDGHADAQPDDRGRDGRRRPPLHRSPGEGYSTTGQINRVAGDEQKSLDRYWLPMALASDAVAKDGGLVGDPTEGALVVLAAKGGVDPVLTRERLPAPGRGAIRRRLQADGDLPQDDRRRRQGGHARIRQGRTGSAARPCDQGR